MITAGAGEDETSADAGIAADRTAPAWRGPNGAAETGGRLPRPALVAGALAVGVVLLAAGITGCGGQTVADVQAIPLTTVPVATPSPTTQPTSTTEAPVEETTTVTTVGTTTTTRKPRPVPTGPPGPLTGAPVDRPGYETRPALVVKIDNYDPDARPQAGLTRADIVYEEKVEGPVSRFAAVFQGADAEQIGPVRSARSTDVQIMGSLRHPLFSYSGANGGFQALLATSPLIDVGAGARGGAYWRGSDKVMPHNLYTSTAGLYAGVPGYTPAPLWSFRGAAEPAGPGARAATGASYQFGGGVTSVTWTWDTTEGGWVRTQNGTIHYDLDNWPVTVANVLIQYVPYQGSTSQDIYGNAIPEAELGGEGRGWLLTGGAAVPVTWARYALEDLTAYAGPDGQPVRFAPGRTWVALIPVQYGATVRFADGTAAS